MLKIPELDVRSMENEKIGKEKKNGCPL